MRIIKADDLTQTVRRLCIDACVHLPENVRSALHRFRSIEHSAIGERVLSDLIANEELAAKNKLPICQDTGMALVFLEIGQDVHIDGSIKDAVNEGVRQGYRDGHLRKSVVGDPLRRTNTGDNTPAVIYFDLVAGDRVRIDVMPKGFGSENMSQSRMLKPADGVKGVKNFVIDVVEKAGSNPCPPVVVGVGIGGTFDQAAVASKKALLRSLDDEHPDPFYADLERELLTRINELGIGPQGYGGLTTALGVKIKALPTHIAGLPCAVTLGCHAARHASAEL